MLSRHCSQGNVHVRKIYPDGREQYTINGIEQSSSPPAIQGPPAGASSSNSARPLNNSRSEQVPIRTHSHPHGKETEDHSHNVRFSRGDRHDVGRSSSWFSRGDGRERDDRRPKRHSHRYDYEAAPPPDPAREESKLFSSSCSP